MSLKCEIDNILLENKLELDLNVKNNSIPHQPKEKYYGNREYKYKIINIDDIKIEKRATQCLFRLHEGNGKALYLLGVNDNGNVKGILLVDLLESIKNIIKIVSRINAIIKKINIYVICNVKNTYCAVIRINKDIDKIYL
jgi:GTPase